MSKWNQYNRNWSQNRCRFSEEMVNHAVMPLNWNVNATSQIIVWARCILFSPFVNEVLVTRKKHSWTSVGCFSDTPSTSEKINGAARSSSATQKVTKMIKRLKSGVCSNSKIVYLVVCDVDYENEPNTLKLSLFFFSKIHFELGIEWRNFVNFWQT